MYFARVDGHATSTVCHPTLQGQIIVICTPIDEKGKATGAPFAAMDPLGAGLHSKVMISTDGSFTAQRLGTRQCPLRNEIIGIIDA